MKRNAFCTFVCAMIALVSFAQLPTLSSGSIERHNAFPSKYIQARTVDVWLPEGYSKEKKYDVLYMHDGQMLFDSTQTWNQQSWNIDETLSQLIREKKINEVIVVAIWNSGATRHNDYFPQKPFYSIPLQKRTKILNTLRTNGSKVFAHDTVQSDNYLKFIVHELKPFIDQTYSTKKGKTHTFITGSSMGGLISIYALCEYPQVFGGAACLSTHWTGIYTLTDNPIPKAMIRYLAKKLPDPATHKIYFDYGTTTLDTLYAPVQKKADQIMRLKGYNSSNWVTKAFKGEEHSEKAWAKRFSIPVLFLMKRNLWNR